MAKGKTEAGMDRDGTSLPAALGFAVVTLPMLGMLVGLWTAPMPAPLHLTEAEPAPEEAGTEEAGVVYIDLPDPLTVATSADSPRAQITLALAIRGDLGKIAQMQGDVLAMAQRISAQMLNEAQQMVSEGADSATLHRDLPERLRAVINDAIGTEEWPEPVSEVLITSIAMQG